MFGSLYRLGSIDSYINCIVNLAVISNAVRSIGSYINLY